jgi:NADP-dependent 3-hydroxy acid dehydrogenase YdfG
MKLIGNIAMITGGAGGTGEATATRFAAGGALVAVADPAEQQAERVDQAIGHYGRMDVPSDPTGAAVFLASRDYLIAQTLNVDAGNWI